MTNPKVLAPLLEYQIGPESSDAWGVRVNPTIKLAGVSSLTITPHVETKTLEEVRGTLQPSYTTIVTKRWGEAVMDGALTYEDGLYLFDHLFEHMASDGATTDAAGTFTWAYAAPTESSDIVDPRVSTILKGDRTYNYSLSGATLKSLKISGETGGELRYSANFIGKDVDSDVHADLSDRDITVAMGDHITLAIDPGSDVAGTTPTSDISYRFELNIDTNRSLVWRLGDQTPNDYKESAWSGSLALTLEANTDSVPYLDAMLDTTTVAVEKVVRITSTRDTDSHFYIDFGGKVTDAPEVLTDDDGVVTVNLNLTAAYVSSSDLCNWLSVSYLSTNSELV